MAQVSDIHVAANEPLPSPLEMMEEIERSAAQAKLVAKSREDIAAVLRGEDPRFLVVVGPCSIHDTEGGLEYAKRLATLQKELSQKLLIVMRVYFEKPRTTVGWKGLIMDPDLDGSNDIPKGLRMARRFLRDVIDLGLPTATELLDPITPQYIADLISWSAIGARTTESQTHRQMASGLSMPLGFKNGTSGSIVAALNAIQAATQPQTFLGVSEQGVASAVSTLGNPNCHVILRGGDDGPNYDATSIAAVQEQLEGKGLLPHVMVDASHANCDKDDKKMPAVFEAILKQRVEGNKGIVGAMLESNLEAGNQRLGEDRSALVHGKSITDKCIDWMSTEKLLRQAADLV